MNLDDTPLVMPDLVLQGSETREQYLETVFDHFCEDFVHNKVTIGGQRIGIESKPWVNGKHRTFWHLISEGPVEPDRHVIIARCERIRWVRFMMENAPRFKTWRNVRGAERSLLIATHDFSYVVVLRQRKGYYYLWSAYTVEHISHREQMQKEHDAYQAQKKALNG